MTKQPEALRLADRLEGHASMETRDKAAAELRRLHEFVIDATVNAARMSVRLYAQQAVMQQALEDLIDYSLEAGEVPDMVESISALREFLEGKQ